MGKDAKIDKESLKALREQRALWIAKARQSIKEQTGIIRQIKDQIQSEGKTIPQIAAGTRLPTARVLQYVATLKTYGEVIEGEKQGDYFTYELAG